MLQVWYSNELERLVAGLVEAVGVERRRLRRSAFDRTPVVVPNGQMATYLKYEVARRTGIAAHMDFPQVDEFFESLLPDGGAYEVLDTRRLQFLLVEALGDRQLLGHKEMAPVRGYLAAAGDDDDALEMRRFQLSRHLAGLFREYDFNRPEMVEQWPEERCFRQPNYWRIEQWQRALWLHLFGAGGRLDALAEETGTRFIRLPEIFERVAPGELQIPAVVHLFGVGRLGRVFERLLGELGERTQVYMWALNPCREFWEDVVTDIDEEAELLSSKAVDGGQLTLMADGGDGPARDETFWDPERFPLPLRLWGRAGRDQMRMLNRLCNHDPRTLFADADATQPTALRQIQRDVQYLERERDEPLEHLDDDSITVLACPGIQREVEVIANEIWSLMRGERAMLDDRPLRLNEICVIVNRDQRVEYQTHLDAVFRDVYDIPFNVIDLAAGAHSRLLEAIDLLLDLPFGDFKRSNLLRLLTHPNVVANLDDVEADTWLRWCDELQIVHGADHADHADTYIDEDLFNWDQGLKRLVLGGFMTGEPSGDERAFSQAGFSYLPHEFAHGESDSAAQLVLTARSLIHDARRCRRDKMPLSDWLALIGEFIEGYFAPTGDDEEFELMRCRALLAELADVDMSGREVSYRVAREFLGGALGDLEMRRGQYLADGVVVSSMVPSRPMPFRVVFVAGMGESYFPTSDGGDPLDLRQARWQEGDAGRRDRDKYAFMQALMGCEERFYASYVARDSRTGEALEPSSVVRDLLHMLEQGYLGPEKTARRVIEHPLRRFDLRYFEDSSAGSAGSDDAAGSEELEPGLPALGTNFHPEARREAAAFMLRESLREHCRERNVPFPELDMLDDTLVEPARSVVTSVLGTYDKPDSGAGDDEVREVSLSFSQLRQFLESPLQASARWILGLRADDEEDLLDVEDELFEASYVRSLLLARDVFLETATAKPLDDEPAFLPAYEDKARYLELRGELPTGPFHAGERKKHLELLQTWRQNLSKLSVPGDRPLTVKRFGRAERHAPVDEIWDSITFELELADGQSVRVELFGESEALDADLSTTVTLLSRSRVKDKDFLRGFFTQLALAAGAKIADDQPIDVVVAPGKSLARARKLSKYRKRLAPITQADALAYLKTIAADFLSGVHAYLMPIEAVFDHFDSEDDTPFAELVEQQINNRWSRCSSEYGPVREPARFAPPSNAKELLERRFAPFFDRLGEAQ